LNPVRLRSYNLSAVDVGRAIVAQNLAVAGRQYADRAAGAHRGIAGRVVPRGVDASCCVRTEAPWCAGDVARVVDGEF